MRERAIEWEWRRCHRRFDEAKVRLDAALAGQDAAACAETAASALAIAYVLMHASGLAHASGPGRHAQIMWSRAELSLQARRCALDNAPCKAICHRGRRGQRVPYGVPAEVVAIVCSAEAVVKQRIRGLQLKQAALKRRCSMPFQSPPQGDACPAR